MTANRLPRRVFGRQGRWLAPWLAALLLLSALAAPLVAAEDEEVTKRQKFLESLKILGAVYERLIYNYVDEMAPEEVLEAGIQGMLDKLDEHSQYLPPAPMEDLMLATEGEFGGLGITISIRDHYPTVLSPIEGTPAYYMGVQGGDQIVEIEGESTYDFSSRDAVQRLRGEPGSKVEIKLKREGRDEPFPLTITRDIIKVESVPYGFMIGDIGYVRIQNFARTTADELRGKLVDLESQGMRGLILDLRFNPGGLLDAAKEVSELFLDKGELLVFTKGRLRAQNVSLYSEPHGPVHDGVPIVVLVNGSSASASEILAAALQDHDAALVVGTTTFGKGSVQTVFRLDDDRGLKLTTARYYTPSGRSIHKERPRHPQGEPQLAGAEVEQDAGELEEEPEAPRHEREQFRTDSGRIVFGGGGIMPDIEIEQPVLNDFQVALERDGALFTYASHYAARHEVPRDFRADDAVLKDFYGYLARRENMDDYLADYELALSDSLYQANRDYVRRGIRRELVRRQFGAEAAYRVHIEEDEQLKQALALYDRADSLQDLLAIAAEWNEQRLRQAALEADRQPAGALEN